MTNYRQNVRDSLWLQRCHDLSVELIVVADWVLLLTALGPLDAGQGVQVGEREDVKPVSHRERVVDGLVDLVPTLQDAFLLPPRVLRHRLTNRITHLHRRSRNGCVKRLGRLWLQFLIELEPSQIDVVGVLH